jgi:tetratricopeptide (TPR) repeat protein
MLVAALGFLAWFWRMSALDSRVYFLGRHAPAEWVMYPKPPQGVLYRSVEWSTEFRKSFNLDKVPAAATLQVRAMDRLSVTLNGTTPAVPTNAGGHWKEPITIDVARQLHAGSNEISVTVFNRNGPPTLWLDLQAGETRIDSGADWEASLLGAAWRKVRLASSPPEFAPGDALAGGERPWRSLLERWPLYLVLVIFCAALVTRGQGWLKKYQERGEPWGPITSKRFAWYGVGIAAIFWVALFLNNAGQLPYVMGFDSINHLEYIDYIKKNWRLPLASEGWQMYQPPLYHIIGALLTAPFQGPGAIATLRLFGLVIGCAQFALVFLSLRLLFPGRPGAQLFGLILAAALPENIYISHYITNEALCGMLATAAIYFCLRILKSEEEPTRLYLWLGLCLGLALLAKLTAVIVVPVIGVALLAKLVAKGRTNVWLLARTVGLVAVLTVAISGWHYARMWRHYGSPLVGNWDGTTGFHWWMEDGFHTAGYFFRFGHSLAYPWYSGFESFGDGLYSTLWGDGLCGGMVDLSDRPPWNYPLMAGGFLLALLPTLLILGGAGSAVRNLIRQPELPWLVLTGVAFATVAAIVYMGLKLPYYAQVKAFYGLVAMLPLCAFAARGWEIILRRGKWAASAAAVVFAVWAMNSYASYWIRTWDAETQITLGGVFARDGFKDRVGQFFAEAYRLDPQNLRARKYMVMELARHGKVLEAKQMLGGILREAPDYAEGHAIYSQFLAADNDVESSLAEARKAVALAPDQIFAYPPLCSHLLKLGRYREAVDIGLDGLRVDPIRIDLRVDTARALVRLGDVTNALFHLRTAVAIKRDSAPALNELAWILATHPDAQWRNGTEALELATRACELTGNKLAQFVGTLAAALAEAGRFDEAVSTANRALELAKAAGDSELAAKIGKMAERFRAKEGYRDGSMTAGKQ